VTSAKSGQVQGIYAGISSIQSKISQSIPSGSNPVIDKQTVANRDDLRNSKGLKAVKQLSFRVDENTHHRIHQAAKKSGKSINSWMEEVVSEAANDVLGVEPHNIACSSPVIQELIDTNKLVDLVKELKGCLKEWEPLFVLDFSASLQKLLIGIDAIRVFLDTQSTSLSVTLSSYIKENSSEITILSLACLPTVRDSNNTIIPEFITALKRFLAGLNSIQIFLKEDRGENTVKVVAKVEKFLVERGA